LAVYIIVLSSSNVLISFILRGEIYLFIYWIA